MARNEGSTTIEREVKPSHHGYGSMGDFIRDLGDRAIKGMTRSELMAAADAVDTTEVLFNNLSRTAEGIGCLVAYDAGIVNKDGRSVGSGALQGADALAVFATIAEGIDVLAAVVYVSGYATGKLLHPEKYGYPVEESRHE